MVGRKINMNRKLLTKVLDELNKESPRLDYVRGIMETILESLPEEKTPAGLGNVYRDVFPLNPVGTTTPRVANTDPSLINTLEAGVPNMMKKMSLQVE